MRNGFQAFGAVLLLGVMTGASQARVIVVDQLGRGEFTSLLAAAAAAEDGDVLLVKVYTNNWPIQTLTLGDKSLTIIGDGGLPDVDRIVVQDLPAGKTILLRGLDLDKGLQILDAAGSVRVEGCKATGLNGSPGGPAWGPTKDGEPGALVSGCADVAFATCTLTGGAGGDVFEDDTDWTTSAGGAGLEAHSSRVTSTYCTLKGGKGGSDYDDGDSGRAGGAGLSNQDSQLVLVGGTLQGGNGGSGGCNIEPYYCGSGGSGGDGLHSVSAGSTSWVRDVESMSGGLAGHGAGGMPDGAPGQPIETTAGTVIPWAQPAGIFRVPSPVREGQPITFLAGGLPGDGIWVLVALGPAQAVLPGFQGALLVAPPLLLQLPIGAVPPSGLLQLSFTAPQLPVALQSLDVYLQAATHRGAVWLLGPASTLTLLDAAF